MDRLNSMPPYRIENLEAKVPIGVIGHNGWRCITMGPDNYLDNIPNPDGWGAMPQYY